MDFAGVAPVGRKLFHLLPQPQAVQIAVIGQQRSLLRLQHAAQPQRRLPGEFRHVPAGHGGKAANAPGLIAQGQQLGGGRLLFGKLPGAVAHRQNQHPVLGGGGKQLGELIHPHAAQGGGVQVIHHGAASPRHKAHRPQQVGDAVPVHLAAAVAAQQVHAVTVRYGGLYQPFPRRLDLPVFFTVQQIDRQQGSGLDVGIQRA